MCNNNTIAKQHAGGNNNYKSNTNNNLKNIKNNIVVIYDTVKRTFRNIKYYLYE